MIVIVTGGGQQRQQFTLPPDVSMDIEVYVCL